MSGGRGWDVPAGSFIDIKSVFGVFVHPLSNCQTQKVQFDICDASVAHLIWNHTDYKGLVQACTPLGQMKNPNFKAEAGFSLSQLSPMMLGKCVRCLCVTGNRLRVNN